MKKTDSLERLKRIDKANKIIMDNANCSSNFLASKDCGFTNFFLNQSNRLYLKYFGIDEHNKKNFYVNSSLHYAKIYKTNITEKELYLISRLSLFIRYLNLKAPLIDE